MSEQEKRIQEIIDDLKRENLEYDEKEAYQKEFKRNAIIIAALESLQRERQEPEPLTCEVIKFARAGEESDKLFTAHIFPEEQIFTVEVRAYNGAARPVAGDVIPRSEYENYDPFLTFEFYQKESVIALRDTCNWIIDTLEGKDIATEPKGEATT